MILVGQYDSPFVRRVAVALHEYGVAYEHRPWSVWAQADEIAPLNPLRRVPVLVLDDGEILVESSAILDALDQLAGGDLPLIVPSGAGRRATLRVCALATGMADKAVSLLYEKALRKGEGRSAVWMERCATQIGDVLDVLEADRASRPGAFWFDRLSHADIAVACALRFLSEAHPLVFDADEHPALHDHAARCEALPSFAAVVQPLHVAV